MNWPRGRSTQQRLNSPLSTSLLLTSCVNGYKTSALGPNIPRDRDDRDPAPNVVFARVHRCADPWEWRQRAFRRAFPMRGH